MIKKIIIAAIMFIPMLASAQSVKIGVVDTQAIIVALPESTEAQNKLSETSKKYDDEYNKLGEEMKRLLNDYQNMKEDELPAIRERKTRELSDYQQKMQQFEQTAMQDLQKLQNDLMAPIMQKVRSAIESVGKENNFSVIQELQSVIYYGAPTEDITPMVKTKLGLQ